MELTVQNKRKRKTNFVDDTPDYIKEDNIINRFLNPRLRIAYISTVRYESKYHLVKLTQSKIVKVSRGEFARFHGSFKEFRGLFYKFNYGTRAQIDYIVRRINLDAEYLSRNSDLELIPESIFSMQGLSDLFSGIQFLLGTAKFVGKTRRQLNDTKPYIDVMLKLPKLILMCNSIEKLSDFKTIIIICIDLWETVVAMKDISNRWEAESINDIALASALSFLPKNISDVLRNLNLLTNTKILDDYDFVSNAFAFIKQFIDLILIPFKNFIPDSVYQWIEQLVNLSPVICIYKMKDLHKKWRKEPLIILQDTFRQEIKQTEIDFETNKDKISSWTRKSPNASSIRNDFIKVFKSVLAYESSSKIEPSCFVFEGKPGTMKSNFVNKLIAVSGLSSYAHTTQSATVGKDWYDAYNNESIFYMDDVGSQDVSQYRNLINFVSPVKTPLECASAELKDTKFFSSEYIFLTTNSFSNISNLTKGDGIANLQALWRRGFVFNFDKTSRIGGYIKGRVTFKHFNISIGSWCEDFPPEIKEEFLSKKMKVAPFFDVSKDNEYSFVAWMHIIIKTFGVVRKNNYHKNTYDKDDIQKVSEAMKLFIDEDLYFDAETINMFSTAGNFANFLDCVIDYVSSHVSDCLHLVKDIEPYSLYLVAGLSAMSMGTLYYALNKKDNNNIVFKAEVEKPTKLNDYVITTQRHNTIAAVEKQVFYIELTHVDQEGNKHVGKSTALFSNRFFITTHHTCTKNRASLIVYKNADVNHRLIDNMYVDKVYTSHSGDISVWTLPLNYPTPFKDLSHIFNDSKDLNRSPVLVTIWGALDVSTLLRKSLDHNTPYVLKMGDEIFSNVIGENNVSYEEIRGEGLCGSPLLSNTGKYMGHHVAGSKEANRGVSISISSQVLSKIYNILTKGISNFKVDVDLSEKVINNFSGIKLNKNFHITTPKKSNYVPSVLHGILPISRVPAKLSINGPHTVKDVAKKSFKPVVDLNREELEFGRSFMLDIIKDFGDLPMSEVIKGTPILAGINKKSSSGYGFPLSKDDYIDYENGVLKDTLRERYDNFKKDLSTGKFRLEEVIWCETLKDELRSVDKDLPRSFRVSTILMQLLTKELFGNMVSNIVCERDYNGIMIGINPYRDWNDLYNEIKSYDHIWAADLGNWDGGMNPQVQQILNEVIVDRFKGDKVLASYVLGFLPNCIVAINDDLFLTTHSMPSGSFLTAIYNSLVNKFYTAMWFYRNYVKNEKRKPTLALFKAIILDKVYGDDRVNGVIGSSFSYLNALTMKEFFNSIGMKFTDSKKGDILATEQEVEEITFLKRSFRYHSLLKQTVGPLDTQTLFSTLSWVDESKDVEGVMKDKVNAFQREIFFHEDLYAQCMEIVKEQCKHMGLHVKFLSEEDLVEMYENDVYTINSDIYGINITTRGDDLSAFKRVCLQNSA